jgi:hypothetical protein
VVDDLLRAALDLGVAALHESKSSSAALVPVAMELAAPPPMPMRMPGPPSWISSVPAGNSIFLRLPRVDAAQAAGDHDGLVVAARTHAGHGLLVLAEVAQQVGPAEFVVERRAAQRAFGHDLQRAGDVLGLAEGLGPSPTSPPQSLDTVKPVRPALGFEPRPGGAFVADLAARAGGGAGEGLMAVGWLCVSTFISTWCSSHYFLIAVP